MVATSRRLTPSKQRVRGFKGIGLPVAVDVIQIGFLGSRKKKGKGFPCCFFLTSKATILSFHPSKSKWTNKSSWWKFFSASLQMMIVPPQPNGDSCCCLDHLGPVVYSTLSTCFEWCHFVQKWRINCHFISFSGHFSREIMICRSTAHGLQR